MKIDMDIEKLMGYCEQAEPQLVLSPYHLRRLATKVLEQAEADTLSTRNHYYRLAVAIDAIKGRWANVGQWQWI